jgi:hypothetical protein
MERRVDFVLHTRSLQKIKNQACGEKLLLSFFLPFFVSSDTDLEDLFG